MKVLSPGYCGGYERTEMSLSLEGKTIVLLQQLKRCGRMCWNGRVEMRSQRRRLNRQHQKQKM